MRANDFLHPRNRLRTFVVRLRLRTGSYTQQIDTTVQARTPEMARRLLQTQYGNRNVVIGQPREMKPR